ncbi:MAG: protein-glutamate O-methyltransferase CheR [Proteobacteria bacterium]|nr:protein-glutamate O-methyltransferase CheR [Pseudomonadota bacterium]
MDLKSRWNGEVSTEVFHGVKEIVAEEAGVDLGSYKDKCIKRRIAVRVRLTGSSSAESYLLQLKEDKEERKKLVAVLTINVTQFFRNSAVFDKVGEIVLPKLFDKRKNDSMVRMPLKIWSAGCSSGEEPYSIAILLLEKFKKEFGQFGASILGTDLDEKVLQKASEGVYSEKCLGEISPELKGRYFSPQPDNCYRITDDVRRLVLFEKDNLLEKGVFERQDIIFCRNMLIYVSREEQERVLIRFADYLHPEGFLVLGKSEALIGTSRELFNAICPYERIYQKKS